jgi:hypothetical protein
LSISDEDFMNFTLDDNEHNPLIINVNSDDIQIIIEKDPMDIRHGIDEKNSHDNNQTSNPITVILLS